MIRMADQRSEAAKAWRAWYGTTRWERRRKDQLAREPLCRMCLAAKRLTPGTVADHVVEHKGDPALFWFGELQTLCAPHHNSTKKADEYWGWSAGVDETGWPTDPRHPGNGGPIR